VPRDYLGAPPYLEDGELGREGTLRLYANRKTAAPYAMADMRGKISAGNQDWISILVWEYASLDGVVSASIRTAFNNESYINDLEPDRFGLASRKFPNNKTSSIDVMESKSDDAENNVIICSRKKKAITRTHNALTIHTLKALAFGLIIVETF